MPIDNPHITDPPALLAIARAARRVGDRDLERAARRSLEDDYGILVQFRRTPADNASHREGDHAR